jgi:hypothetical protein
VHDDFGFALIGRVDEALVAPPDFDSANPIELTCGWNQPYMWFDADGIDAHFSFYLLFGAEGVKQTRELLADLGVVATNAYPVLLPLLRSCFDPAFGPGYREWRRAHVRSPT